MNLQIFLKNEYSRRKCYNKQYSLRAFARDLDLESSVLIKIINGSRKVGPKISRHIEDKFFIPEGTFNSSKSDHSESFQLEEHAHFNIISQWEHFAVLNALSCPNFISTHHFIMHLLSISKDRASTIVEELLRVGLMKKDESGNWVRSHGHCRTTHDVSSLALRFGNREFLDLAKEKLESVPLEKRDYTSVVLPVDADLLPFIKDVLAKFRDDLEILLDRIPQKKNQVYQLNLQLFPLTKKIEEAEINMQESHLC
jgi:uncharacterized protein (TIGR02147 family)